MNKNVACRLSTAFFRALKKIIYLEETLIPGSTFASKMKIFKPNRAALKQSKLISHRRQRRQQTIYLAYLIASYRYLFYREQTGTKHISFIPLPIHDKKIIKRSDTVVMYSCEVNNATAGSFSNIMNT